MNKPETVRDRGRQCADLHGEFGHKVKHMADAWAAWETRCGKSITVDPQTEESKLRISESNFLRNLLRRSSTL